MGKEKKKEEIKVMNRLNSQIYGTWQAANKRAVLPFVHRIFDVGFEKAGPPAPVQQNPKDRYFSQFIVDVFNLLPAMPKHFISLDPSAPSALKTLPHQLFCHLKSAHMIVKLGIIATASAVKCTP